MKCPYCGQEHPDNFKFCPNTAKALVNQLKACTNKKCRDFGKNVLPADSKYCPSCGEPIASKTSEVSVDLDLIHVLREKLKKRIVEILN